MSRPHLLLPFAMLVPSLALVIWIMGYPVADLMRMSVHAVNRFGQAGNFVGSKRRKRRPDPREPERGPMQLQSLPGWLQGIHLGQRIEPGDLAIRAQG